jgi:hypothetical protein
MVDSKQNQKQISFSTIFILVKTNITELTSYISSNTFYDNTSVEMVSKI